MIHHLVKLVIEVAAGVAAAVAVNEGVRYFTGKSLLEHLSNVAAPLRDDIAAWCNRNPEQKVRKLVLRALRAADNVLSAGARMRVVRATVETESGNNIVVSERSITPEQFAKMFGGTDELVITQ